MNTLLAVLFSSLSFAHAGHQASSEAPKGPFKIVQKEEVFLPCSNGKLEFKAPFEKITLRELTGYKNDYSVLLGKDVRTLTAGDQLKTAKLVTEHCEKPMKVRCDGRGQPRHASIHGLAERCLLLRPFQFRSRIR